MTAAKKTRRAQINETPSVPEELDPVAMEIPADAKAAGKTVEQQIQDQIAIQMAKKTSGDTP